METIRGKYNEINCKDKLTLSFGNFDGMHLGHQELIRISKTFLDTRSAIITFDPHPMVFFGNKEFSQLTSIDDRLKLAEENGVDYAFVIEFDEDFSKLNSKKFIKFLKGLKVKRIVVGLDAKFACNGEGNIGDLMKNFQTVVANDYMVGNDKVSSSAIRKLLSEGDVLKASQFLGRNYTITGKVVDGNKVGRKLGFPTANIDYDSLILPKSGVYSGIVIIDGKKYRAMANIGKNPTINKSKKTKLEVYILEFTKDIYGKIITIEFINYLRGETKFKTKEELIAQMRLDEVNTHSTIYLSQ